MQKIKVSYKYTCAAIISGCLSVFIMFTVYAQGKKNIPPGQNIDQPYISWVNQYPAFKDGKEKKNVFVRFFDFIIKKNAQRSLVRPVGVFANGLLDFCVLDQGSQTIFDIKDNKGDIPRCIKRKENNFTSLVGICSTPDKEILFTDSRLNKIFVVSADKKKLSVLND